MPWFKIDDGFHGHPKVMELSPAAVGIWTLAGTWCANYLTDGEVKAGVVRRFGGTDELIQELVDAGLWIDTGEFYKFKDWEDYQPMKADVEAEREVARARMRSARARKNGVDSSPQHKNGSENVQPNNTRTTPEVRVTPSLPVPSQPSPATKDSPTPKAPTYTEEFETAWALYPNRKSKKAAATSFAKALKEVPLETLLAAIARYGDDPNRQEAFTKNFSTWLNQGCWDDDPIAPRTSGGQFLTASDQRLARGAALMEKYTNTDQLQIRGAS